MSDPAKTWSRSWIMRLLVTCVSLGIVAALGQLVPQVYVVWQQIRWEFLACAVGLTIIYRVLNAWGWGVSLRALRHRMPSKLVLCIWLRSEACRWLPGSVWCLGSRAFLAGEAGVASSVAAASVLLELALTILAWVAACGLGLAVGGITPLAVTSHLPIDALAFFVLLVASGVAVSGYWLQYFPAGQKRLARIQEKLTTIQSLRPHIGWCATNLGYYLALCVLNGLALQYVIWAFAPDVHVPLLTVVGINALAWLVGFFTIIAPSGVVVREGCIAGLLMVWMPETSAIAVAVTWRLVQIGVEIACLLFTYVPATFQRIFGNDFRLSTRS